MSKLLVNAPSGKQEITEIEQSGGYYDAARVLWDERTDGEMPAIILGKMQRIDNNLTELPEYLPAYIDEVREIKRLELRAAYEIVITSPIAHNSITWAAGKEDQSLLVACLSAGAVPEGMYWRDLAGAAHPMTFADLQALAGAILMRGLVADSNLQSKLQAVASASTLADVSQITW
jgi:hypothetical protein